VHSGTGGKGAIKKRGGDQERGMLKWGLEASQVKRVGSSSALLASTRMQIKNMCRDGRADDLANLFLGTRRSKRFFAWW
jgi:hypothetical protein